MFCLNPSPSLHRKKKNPYSSEFGRFGSASAASNASIPVELWGQHLIGLLSFKCKKRYIKRDIKILNIFFRFFGGYETTIIFNGYSLNITFRCTDDTRTYTTFDVLDDSIPIEEGVPKSSFRWLEEPS